MNVTFPKKPAQAANAVVVSEGERSVVTQSYLPEVGQGVWPCRCSTSSTIRGRCCAETGLTL